MPEVEGKEALSNGLNPKTDQVLQGRFYRFSGHRRRGRFAGMTPAQLKRGIDALRIKLKQLEHGERIAYWELLDALDHSNAELSQALDGELTRLLATGELVFIDDEEEGGGRMVERRAPVTKKPDSKKKKPVALKKAAKKKPVAKKKAAKR